MSGSANTSTAQRAIKSLLEEIDAPTATFFTSCVHCGMCADACLFYTETLDPKYIPIYKLLPLRRVWQQEYTFWGRITKALGLSKPLSERELQEWEELVYDSCTLCGRCSLVCPMGNDLTYMIRKLREGMSAAGHTPKGLREATTRAVETGSPMGVTLDTLKAHIKHAEQETGLTVPMDVEGAEYLFLLSSAEIADFSEIIPAVTRIFHHAGVSWTLSSDAFEGTNSGVQIGASDIAAELVQRIVDAAEKLKVKSVICSECGHAYVALRWEGPNLIGKSFSFGVIHILELLDQLRKQDRIKLKDKVKNKLTFHDPCQIVRRGGVVDEPRRLIESFAEDFVEMKEHGTMNWCCGGGGGVAANERAKPLRLRVFSRKKQQVEETGADTIVTACSNCRNMLADGLEHYGMNVDVVGLTETLAEHLET